MVRTQGVECVCVCEERGDLWPRFARVLSKHTHRTTPHTTGAAPHAHTRPLGRRPTDAEPFECVVERVQSPILPTHQSSSSSSSSSSSGGVIPAVRVTLQGPVKLSSITEHRTTPYSGGERGGRGTRPTAEEICALAQGPLVHTYLFPLEEWDNTLSSPASKKLISFMRHAKETNLQWMVCVCVSACLCGAHGTSMVERPDALPVKEPRSRKCVCGNDVCELIRSRATLIASNNEPINEASDESATPSTTPPNANTRVFTHASQYTRVIRVLLYEDVRESEYLVEERFLGDDGDARATNDVRREIFDGEIPVSAFSPRASSAATGGEDEAKDSSIGSEDASDAENYQPSPALQRQPSPPSPAVEALNETDDATQPEPRKARRNTLKDTEEQLNATAQAHTETPTKTSMDAAAQAQAQSATPETSDRASSSRTRSSSVPDATPWVLPSLSSAQVYPDLYPEPLPGELTCVMCVSSLVKACITLELRRRIAVCNHAIVDVQRRARSSAHRQGEGGKGEQRPLSLLRDLELHATAKDVIARLCMRVHLPDTAQTHYDDLLTWLTGTAPFVSGSAGSGGKGGGGARACSGFRSLGYFLTRPATEVVEVCAADVDERGVSTEASFMQVLELMCLSLSRSIHLLEALGKPSHAVHKGLAALDKLEEHMVAPNSDAKPPTSLAWVWIESQCCLMAYFMEYHIAVTTPSSLSGEEGTRGEQGGQSGAAYAYTLKFDPKTRRKSRRLGAIAVHLRKCALTIQRFLRAASAFYLDCPLITASLEARATHCRFPHMTADPLWWRSVVPPVRIRDPALGNSEPFLLESTRPHLKTGWLVDFLAAADGFDAAYSCVSELLIMYCSLCGRKREATHHMCALVDLLHAHEVAQSVPDTESPVVAQRGTCSRLLECGDQGLLLPEPSSTDGWRCVGRALELRRCFCLFRLGRHVDAVHSFVRSAALFEFRSARASDTLDFSLLQALGRALDDATAAGPSIKQMPWRGASAVAVPHAFSLSTLCVRRPQSDPVAPLELGLPSMGSPTVDAFLGGGPAWIVQSADADSVVCELSIQSNLAVPLTIDRVSIVGRISHAAVAAAHGLPSPPGPREALQWSEVTFESVESLLAILEPGKDMAVQIPMERLRRHMPAYQSIVYIMLDCVVLHWGGVPCFSVAMSDGIKNALVVEPEKPVEFTLVCPEASLLDNSFFAVVCCRRQSEGSGNGAVGGPPFELHMSVELESTESGKQDVVRLNTQLGAAAVLFDAESGCDGRGLEPVTWQVGPHNTYCCMITCPALPPSCEHGFAVVIPIHVEALGSMDCCGDGLGVIVGVATGSQAPGKPIARYEMNACARVVCHCDLDVASTCFPSPPTSTEGDHDGNGKEKRFVLCHSVQRFDGHPFILLRSSLELPSGVRSVPEAVEALSDGGDESGDPCVGQECSELSVVSVVDSSNVEPNTACLRLEYCHVSGICSHGAVGMSRSEEALVNMAETLRSQLRLPEDVLSGVASHVASVLPSAAAQEPRRRFQRVFVTTPAGLSAPPAVPAAFGEPVHLSFRRSIEGERPVRSGDTGQATYTLRMGMVYTAVFEIWTDGDWWIGRDMRARIVFDESRFGVASKVSTPLWFNVASLPPSPTNSSDRTRRSDTADADADADAGDEHDFFCEVRCTFVPLRCGMTELPSVMVVESKVYTASDSTASTSSALALADIKAGDPNGASSCDAAPGAASRDFVCMGPEGSTAVANVLMGAVTIPIYGKACCE